LEHNTQKAHSQMTLSPATNRDREAIERLVFAVLAEIEEGNIDMPALIVMMFHMPAWILLRTGRAYAESKRLLPASALNLLSS